MSSFCCRRTTPAMSKRTAVVDATIAIACREVRDASGNPSLRLSLMCFERCEPREILFVWALADCVGTGIDCVAASTFSRRPMGNKKAGATPKSASGAYFERVFSQIAHSSIWRATRLRMRTLNSPFQPEMIAASSLQSWLPILATVNAPRLFSIRSRMR